jgi:hypothetical protein
METYLKNGRNIKQLADRSEELIDKYGFTKQSVRNLIDSKVNMEEVVEVARRTGINDASKYIRMIDSPTEAKYVVGKPNFAGLTKAGDIGELKASRELAKSTGGKITQLKNIHKLDDGTYVLHSSSPDVVDAGDIDAMVVKKSGDTVEIQRVVEVYSGGNAGKAIGKKSQINKIRADLTKNPGQIIENSDISVSFADDLRQEIYLASETAAKTDSGAGTTVQKSIESSGEYTVRKFNIE